jgi:hypothetical protein
MLSVTESAMSSFAIGPRSFRSLYGESVSATIYVIAFSRHVRAITANMISCLCYREIPTCDILERNAGDIWRERAMCISIRQFQLATRCLFEISMRYSTPRASR